MSTRFKNLKVVEAGEGFDFGTLSLTAGDQLRLLPGRREVFHAKLVGEEVDLVAKCYLPHAKQTRDWQCEWKGLLQLQALGLPCPRAVAVCRGEVGEVCVLMSAIPDAVTLGEFIRNSASVESRVILEKLVELVDRLHEAGARQSDQHIDNWAVSHGEIFLLDAGTFHFAEKPLNVEERLKDLAAICATLPPEAEAIFRGFLEAGYGMKMGDARAEVLGSFLNLAIVDLQQERARRYFKKTQRTCTEFDVRSEAGRSGMYARPAPSGLVDRFFSDPEALMQVGERLKSGNTCTVQKIEYDGRHYVLKRYNVKTFFTQFRRSLGPSRAALSWSNAWVLNLLFVNTAKPVAYLDETGFPRGCSYLLMEAIDGPLLPEYVGRVFKDEAKFTSLVDSVGFIWDTLWQMRAVHGDLKATNWIVDAEGEVYLFDLDSFQFGLSKAAFLKGRNKDMKRFLKNWESSPDIAGAFRRRMEGGDHL